MTRSTSNASALNRRTPAAALAAAAADGAASAVGWALGQLPAGAVDGASEDDCATATVGTVMRVAASTNTGTARIDPTLGMSSLLLERDGRTLPGAPSSLAAEAPPLDGPIIACPERH